MSQILVQKRDGRFEPFQLDKIHRVLEWATEGVTGVSISEIELRANIQLYDGIPAYNIHDLLIKSASELISEDTPNYQYVAARLVSYKLRKEVYGRFEPHHILEIINKNISLGYYNPQLLEQYDIDEINKIESFISHDRDNLFSYVGMEQLRSKYLIKDRQTNRPFETPQVAYILISMTLFMSENKDVRLKYVKEFYDLLSTHAISLPTPIMADCRTVEKQYSSCTLIECADSLDSINGTATAIVNYASKKAGIGIGAGAIRAIGDLVGPAKRTVHTGIIPYLKYFVGALKSCAQGAVRGASATICLPIWHREFESLIVLRNNKGLPENRIRNMDYCFQLNKLFYERLITDSHISFFSPKDVPGLYESFYADQSKFKSLYEAAENDVSISRVTLPAIEVFTKLATERKDTGRIYIMNVDHANSHGSFIPELAPIRMTNLCVEVTLPTKPVDVTRPSDGEIALCTLGAINWGQIKSPEDFERPCKILVRALDNLLSYQKYMHEAAFTATMARRPLGIGIINLANFLAQRDLKYDKKALKTIDEYAEAWSYYLIEASVELAEERGACPLSNETKYHFGILPIDTYKKTVDDLVKPVERMRWEFLRDRLAMSGIRNSTLMAGMPAETSAQIPNATNGVEPPRALVSFKQSKDGVSAQVVPGVHHLKNKYDLLWDQETPEGYLSVMAVLQKYMDQSISSNTSYDPKHFPKGEIPMSQLIGDIMYAYRYGLKTLYYNNTNDGAGEVAPVSEIPEAIKEPEEDCDSCKI